MKSQEVLKLKEQIKTLSEAQKSLKNQRKTIYIVGERTIPSSEATWKYQLNRQELRHLFIAYGFMRGKTIEQIESKNHSAFDETKVQKIIDKLAISLQVYPVIMKMRGYLRN